MTENTKSYRIAYAVANGKKEENGKKKSFWLKIGAAFRNSDNSETIILDAFPVDGRIILRDPLKKEE